MNDDAYHVSTDSTYIARLSDHSEQPSSPAQARSLESLPAQESAPQEAAILAAHTEVKELLSKTFDYPYLPWSRIASDATFRTALVVELFNLARPALGQQRINRTFAFGRCDGSEGNSGRDRDFDPTPWL